PVKLLMSSKDVIHSFFVPSFRVKMDVLPNRYTALWFEATQEGEFDLYCTEYCGKGHSEMLGKVVVMREQDYNDWLKSAAEASMQLSLVDYGEQLYRTKACITCHSIDGSANQGPTWKGVFGATEKLADGSEVVVDENYIRESILNPFARITAGYQPIMPPFQGILSDRDVDALIEYIKTLK
ncbi:MAG: c-type cytochrome, partial [bacterium]